MIELTLSAQNKIKELAEDFGSSVLGVRIRIIGGGCAGFAFDMYLDETEPLGTDEVMQAGDIRVVVDELSMNYLDGTVVDYVEGDFGDRFKFNCPNISNLCGCGNSVSF